MLRAVILIFAIAAGGAAAWFTMPNTDDTTLTSLAAPPSPPTIGVLVAATDLAPGAALAAGTLRWQAWPVDAVSASFITQNATPDAFAEMAGMIVRTSLAAGEPVYGSRLVGSEAGGYLSVMLTAGRRAVAVRISAENTAGGFILPDDHVDVLHTVSSLDGSGTMQAKSSLILQNVRVLAIDQMIADRQSDSVVGKTATLELNAAQVEAITAAEASGAISLALRAVADNSEPSELPPVTPRTVEIFRAGGVEVIHLAPSAASAGSLPTGGT